MSEHKQLELLEHQAPWMQLRRHWASLPLAPPIVGTFQEVLNAVPHFGRQPFAMASPNGEQVGINSFLDMVYRVPTRPNGIVLGGFSTGHSGCQRQLFSAGPIHQFLKTGR